MGRRTVSEVGFRTISLEPRILRAETAALVAVVLVQQGVRNFRVFPVR
ncbi:MAG: hypothetical protein D3917_10890 [Candidatus Electrothrix sp. AX5]|nr:hypothetical protein [Candidatus Electrothrix sp. AX5]